MHPRAPSVQVAGVAVVGAFVVTSPAICDNSSTLKSARPLTTWRRAAHPILVQPSDPSVQVAGVAVVGSFVVPQTSRLRQQFHTEECTTPLTTWWRAHSRSWCSQVIRQCKCRCCSRWCLRRYQSSHLRQQFHTEECTSSHHMVASSQPILVQPSDPSVQVAGVAVVGAFVVTRPAICDNSSTLKSARPLTTWRRAHSRSWCSQVIRQCKCRCCSRWFPRPCQTSRLQLQFRTEECTTSDHMAPSHIRSWCSQGLRQCNGKCCSR